MLHWCVPTLTLLYHVRHFPSAPLVCSCVIWYTSEVHRHSVWKLVCSTQGWVICVFSL